MISHTISTAFIYYSMHLQIKSVKWVNKVTNALHKCKKANSCNRLTMIQSFLYQLGFKSFR